MSFIGRSTQGEIAARLGVSPAKVHRLIASAQKQGLIKFYVDARPNECLELESHLAQELGISNCFIAPDVSASSEQSPFASVASFAGQYLHSLLSGGSVDRIGVGMGRTLKAMVEAMPRLQRSDLEIISISGSLTRRLSANPYDVVQQLQSTVGGEAYYLPVPYLAESTEERDTFLAQRAVQDLLSKARSADLFVVGIGSVEEEGHLIQRRLVSRDESKELAKSTACSDICGRFVDINGKESSVSLNQKAVGLHYKDIQQARVIAVAGGEGKATATLAATRTGAITDLIIDEGIAKELASLLQQSRQPELC
ncbi:MarR family transcriptional regulator [Rhodobacteraceae bacterium RKSG542]|nr:sugar-binding domain-containing protein [Pseudovibrio flavus]MTI17216.1 MarR family transcriptional regulator [Pseudovibrio flavus]